MDDLISREVAAKILRARAKMSVGTPKSVFYAAAGMIDKLPSVDAELVITGETSDGYHTFNELYHHRAVLFSVIVKAFPERAWKARQHHDGTMYDGMFIVGIDTPRGQATYHYDIDPYWDIFECPELERAPEWDGHTPEEAIDRIGKLIPLRVTRCKDCAYYEYGEHFHDMQFCCRLHGEDGTTVRYNFEPNAFCSYGETPEEQQQREASENSHGAAVLPKASARNDMRYAGTRER